MPAGFLKIRELGNLHAVEPDLPAQSPRAQRRRFPIILPELDVMFSGINPQGRETVQVQRLDRVHARLDDHLVLIIVLQPVGIFTVPSIGRTTARLDVCRTPGLRPQGTQKSGRVEGTGALFQIIRLTNDTVVFRPKLMKREDKILNGHEGRCRQAPVAVRPDRQMNVYK